MGRTSSIKRDSTTPELYRWAFDLPCNPVDPNANALSVGVFQWLPTWSSLEARLGHLDAARKLLTEDISPDLADDYVPQHRSLLRQLDRIETAKRAGRPPPKLEWLTDARTT